MATQVKLNLIQGNWNMLKFVPMDIQSEKEALAKLILESKDQVLIGKIRLLFNESDKQHWEQLPQHVRDGIKRGLEQAANGQGTPHHEVMLKYEDYLRR